jgi:hypothetical protein
MTNKLIASIVALAVLAAFCVGCGSQGGGSSSTATPPKPPSGKTKVDENGNAGKGGAIPDLNVDR